MTMQRKDRIARSFGKSASRYDAAATVQDQVASALARRLPPLRRQARILEVGCGTGLFSGRLGEAYPDADLLLTDIAPAMVEACYMRMSGRGAYQPLDGEHPEALSPGFDLIASSLVFQWFEDLAAALARLAALLAPGGRLVFATLLAGSFAEWRAAHEALGLEPGTPAFPAEIPWPPGFAHHATTEILRQPYPDGAAFLHSLRDLGAATPVAGHRPIGAGAMRRLLAALGENPRITYEILFGQITRGEVTAS